MIGGLIVQLFADKFDPNDHIDHGLTRRIQNSALDFLVVAAIATIKLNIVLKGWLPLVILIIAGILWNVFCVLFLAKRVFKNAWFERSIAEMGQSMGVTATGLLLLRVVDPDYKTPAAEAFACKQLLHEPFMGGGLWTGMAIPLLAAIGIIPVLAISCTAVIIWGTILAVTGQRT
jgi:ESS family glutamate:Na+ symporter